MHLGLVGLGKMGGNMRERLRRAGLTVTGYDRNPEVSDVPSLAALVEALPSCEPSHEPSREPGSGPGPGSESGSGPGPGSGSQAGTESGAPPKVVWVMVPAGEPTRATVAELAELLPAGSIVVDGGNSRWTDDQRHAAMLAEKEIGYVDCGVSGGVWGLENGYALMYGGSAADVATLEPVFTALKPPGEFGAVHAGPVGAGHFSKMVHNGIEYAIMQAYAEGWELLEKVDLVENVPEIFNSWREGTVIRSWLLDLMVAALQEDPHLSELAGYAEDSGEGRWTVEAGIEHAVATPAITAALYARFVSRQEDSPAMKAIAAMRNQFGGHAVHRT